VAYGDGVVAVLKKTSSQQAGGPLPPPPRRERSLVRAAQRGDAAAFAALFRAHWPMAYRAAWLIVRDERLAEDVAQEAFVAAAGALDRFDRRRPFAPWLRTIVARRAIDAARAVAVRREVGDEALAALPAPVIGPPVDLELLAAVAALPLDQRAVVVLRHLLGMSATEIAAALDVPRGTVNSRLRRGLDALRAGMPERSL
jgi:RNA polymerase sigma-70 factor (ECF subfamily)